MKIIQYFCAFLLNVQAFGGQQAVLTRAAHDRSHRGMSATQKIPRLGRGIFCIGWMEFYLAFSVVPQCFDGAHLGGLLRRVNAEDDADTSREEHGTDDGDLVNTGGNPPMVQKI